MMKKTKHGFTLIELLMVIAIIALLASIVLASLSGARKKALDSAGAQDLNQIKNALELFRSKYGRYPANPSLGDSFGYGYSCWDSNAGVCQSHRDSGRLSVLNEFMPKRPVARQRINPSSASTTGYFYKVDGTGGDYLLCLMNALSNVANRPASMFYQYIVEGLVAPIRKPLDVLAMCVGSSDATKEWGWNTQLSGYVLPQNP